jgi:hypothetical protein
MKCYRDQYFCSYSFKCKNTSCENWIDLNVDIPNQQEPLCIRNMKTKECGYISKEEIPYVRD